ncbi:MAG: multicopper oxidase domain-containing protein [Chromatiaceae bacterium]
MTTKTSDHNRTRRLLLKGLGGGLLATAGISLLPPRLNKLLSPIGLAEAQTAYPPPDLFFAGTDGWISLPKTPAIFSNSLGVKTHPDPLAPDPFSTYIFGFRNVTGLTDTQRAAQKNKAQHSAPMFWLDEFNPANPKDFRMQLTNLGLALRPDLFDAHTIHWHGFRNVITFFDGEPTGSIAVTTGRIFQYIYRPRDPGTYMFHCHVEDVEHVHMGMTGPVFVRPRQNGTSKTYQGRNYTKFAYNDGDGSTGYDREFAMFCSEVWGDSHWADAHIQLPEWSDYRADFCLLNGRVYPDTLAPNAPLDPTAFNSPATLAALHALPVQVDGGGDLVAPAGRPDLQYQPLSALVTCNAGERVLLRFANLGFKEAAMTLAGIKMRVVGKDATPMAGRDGTDTSFEASTVSFGAGESIDAIFTAPPKTGAGYDTYVLYDRAYERSNNLANGNVGGGRRTEVRVYAAGTLPPQSLPNT